jgi:26S proteasome regulatory subunit N10
MVLEAVMICVDNSEPMRNGDYTPTRFSAMVEAVNEIANAKINGNAETTVGLLSMAGRIEVHLSPCRSLGPLMTALQKEVKIGGESSLVGALKTAQLALKNRPNKSQKQRIVVFVGSPVAEDVKEMTKLGKQFKKNNVAVDIINFGTENGAGAKTENPEKLEALVQAANASENSHLVHIPPGPHIFSDLVLTSAVMVGGGVVGTSTQAPTLGLGGQAIDPNMEPELAMALRISQEEERQRQEKIVKDSKSDAKVVQQSAAMDETADDEQQMLAAAIAMSMAADNNNNQSSNAPSNNTTTNKPANTSSNQTSTNSSNNTNQAANKPAPKAESTEMTDDVAQALQDPDFINGLLGEVGGVTVEDIMADMTDDKDPKAKNNKKEEPKKDGKK